MDSMDFFFADKNEIIIDALIGMLKAKVEELGNLQELFELKQEHRIELEHELASLKKTLSDIKKEAKAPDLPIVKSVKMVRGKLPKATKKAVEPVKRGRGRPKKVAA